MAELKKEEQLEQLQLLRDHHARKFSRELRKPAPDLNMLEVYSADTIAICRRIKIVKYEPQ